MQFYPAIEDNVKILSKEWSMIYMSQNYKEMTVTNQAKGRQWYILQEQKITIQSNCGDKVVSILLLIIQDNLFGYITFPSRFILIYTLTSWIRYQQVVLNSIEML